MELSPLSKALKDKRIALGMTTAQFATFLGLPSDESLLTWESGHELPAPEDVARLAQAVNVAPKEALINQLKFAHPDLVRELDALVGLSDELHSEMMDEGENGGLKN